MGSNPILSHMGEEYENTDKILVHVQSVIDLFAKQLNNALNLHYVYHQNTGVIRAIFHKCP